MPGSPIARRIRHAKRYTQVLEVIAGHGFADAAEQLGLFTLIERGRIAVGATPHEPRPHLTLPERLRTLMEDLGPTYVKLGQVMSTRPDLVPQEWADEFKKLQNKVPGVEYDVIHKMLEKEFPGELKRLFRTIDKKPLAAGSVAQVHRARLHDGTRIVLKVLRPDIRELTGVDMEILHSLAQLVEEHFANLGYSPTEVVNEFAKELRREVDLTYEGRSTERLGDLFANDPEIVFPRVYWEATTINVLAMEEIKGFVLADLKPDKLSAKDRRIFVENGARAVFAQCLEFGFFHADPHPGNLMALSHGRIAFIDCGMTGQVDDRTARQLADLVAGVVDGDLDRVIAVAGDMTDVGQDKLDNRALRADVNEILSEFRGTPLERLNLGRVLNGFFAALRRHQIRCPADIMLLIKALTMIESVGRDVDPSFDMVEFVRPYIEDLVGKRYSTGALVGRFRRSAARYLELVEDLPQELRTIFSQLRRNRLAVNLEHRGLDHLTNTVEHASRNISFSLIIAAIFVGSSILVHAARDRTALTIVGYSGLGASVVLVVVMIISNRRIRGWGGRNKKMD
jgi:ubiquinone biosynthesis protein